VVSRRAFVGWSAFLGLSNLAFPGAGFSLEDGRPSRTAFGAARHRAAHQLYEDPRVFDDPLALRILGAQVEGTLRDSAGGARDEGARAMRAFIAMRSRYTEDRLAEAVARGVRQYVVLGAGLDTFAYRNRFADLKVFEVDHPATQAWKRERLREAGIAIPGSLVFAPVDFEKQTLAGGLAAAGFRAGEPAFLSMLGVVIYLTRDAVTGTMRFAGSLPAGSEIVFDFALPPDALGEIERIARESSAARVAAISEPWLSYFDPDTLARELRSLGFSQTTVLGTGEGNERYFRDRADGFRLRGSGRMMAARV
jgi:methyltransferase (TIGR00027 family)